MLTFLIYYFFQLKKKKEKKPFCSSKWSYTQQGFLKKLLSANISTFSCTTCPRADPAEPHITQNGQSHLTTSDSNPNRAIFWGGGLFFIHEFDKLSVSHFVASKLEPIFFFMLYFSLGKCIDLPRHPISSSKSTGETEFFANSCD